MIERLLIVTTLLIVGLVVYRLVCRQRVERATRAAGVDPLLLEFRTGVPGIVLFTADFCHPCKSQQRPAIEGLTDHLGQERVQVFQVDVETQPDVANRWGVLSLPTTVILAPDGQPKHVNHGVTGIDVLLEQLRSVV